MAPSLLNKYCKRCEKSFFTYDDTMIFCNHTCEGRYKYFERYPKQDKSKIKEGNCYYCKEPIKRRGVAHLKFCNEHCKKKFINQENRKRSLSNPKTALEGSLGNPKRKKVSYDELNRREEHKRVFEDHSWLYRHNRDKI
jgi:hypothetical protein